MDRCGSQHIDHWMSPSSASNPLMMQMTDRSIDLIRNELCVFCRMLVWSCWRNQCPSQIPLMLWYTHTHTLIIPVIDWSVHWLINWLCVLCLSGALHLWLSRTGAVRRHLWEHGEGNKTAWIQSVWPWCVSNDVCVCVCQWNQPSVMCVVFDITSEASFTSCSRWLDRVRSHCNGLQVPGQRSWTHTHTHSHAQVPPALTTTKNNLQKSNKNWSKILGEKHKQLRQIRNVKICTF